MNVQVPSLLRWNPAPALLLGLLLITGFGCRPEQAPTAEISQDTPANLLLISLDTVRADHLGIYGAQDANTPNLDRLGREGAVFTAASSAVPLTLPSHATLMTGLLPLHHGLRLNGLGRLPESHTTLAETLSASGFQTAAFVGAFVLDHRFGLDQGFSLYDDAIERSRDGRSPRLESERPAGVVVDRALAWLSGSSQKQPFFLFVHLYDAHAPYLPPEPWRERFAKNPYAGEIAYVDQQVGRLIAELEKSGELDRTLVVVLADHGESLGEHGEETHGLLLYEKALHVPLLMRAPGRIPAGRIVTTEVGLVDLAPTLASLLSLSFPPRTAPGAGRDLGPLLSAQPDEKTLADRILYAETEYPASFGWSPLAATRKDHLKLILSPRPELFDLEKDPRETVDRKEEERRSLRQLDEAAQAIRASAVVLTTGAVDDEARQRLASLGYAAPAATVTGRLGSGHHPRDRMADFHRWERVEERIRLEPGANVLPELEKLVAADPGNPVFRTSLARLARARGRHQQALELYRQALRDAPRDPDAWQDLAAAFYEVGQAKECAAAAAQALALDERRPDSLTLLALAELQMGRPEVAADHLRRVLELDPRHAVAHANLGNLLRGTGRLEAAETEYRRALELAPALVDAWNGLGTLLVELERAQEAIPFFRQALILEPGFEEARLNLGIASQLAGDEKGARTIFQEVLRRTEGQPRFAAQHDAARQLLGL